MRAAPGRQRTLGRHPPARDEEGPRIPRFRAGRYEAALEGLEPCDPVELAADPLERLQPVAQPGGVLVAACVGELRQSAAKARQRERRSLELVRPKRACRKLRLSP